MMSNRIYIRLFPSRMDSVAASIRHGKLMGELEKFFVPIDCSGTKLISWPEDVKLRWESLNGQKYRRDLGFLTWNVNGRMDLRGCRESLLRRWVLSGPVDVVLIQEQFRAGNGTSVNFLNKDWWHISSDAVGGSIGRKSGGCAVLVQPCLLSEGGFSHPGGRICGMYTHKGLILTLYFPTKSPGQSREEYLKTFTIFVDQLILFVECKMVEHPVSWIAFGTDTNAHFKGTGIPPRRNDAFAAKQVRRFMRNFSLVSLGEKMCPAQFTCLNSHGGISCLDTFLVSSWLYDQH